MGFRRDESLRRGSGRSPEKFVCCFYPFLNEQWRREHEKDRIIVTPAVVRRRAAFGGTFGPGRLEAGGGRARKRRTGVVGGRGAELPRDDVAGVQPEVQGQRRRNLRPLRPRAGGRASEKTGGDGRDLSAGDPGPVRADAHGSGGPGSADAGGAGDRHGELGSLSAAVCRDEAGASAGRQPVPPVWCVAGGACGFPRRPWGSSPRPRWPA